MDQQIRFCTAPDGVRLAYAMHGRGPAIVKVANWVTHVESDWESPLWRHWWQELGRDNQVVRYDIRGCGLSDRDPERLSLDAFVEDLETVVGAARLGRFTLLGISQGAAAAICYAVRHPDRVSHLVLYGGYARGRRARGLSEDERAEDELLQSIVRIGWGKADPEFRRVFTTRFVPEATVEQMRWFEEMMRVSVSPRMAARLRDVWAGIDVTDLLAQVTAPTLVAHGRGDVACPFEEGRLLATGIPNARLLPLDSRNHTLLATEPAWQVFVTALRAFLGGDPRTAPVTPHESLSDREGQVLDLLAGGLTNEQIADHLCISPRTVERHLSNLYAKLGVSGKAGRAAAAAYSARRQLPTEAADR